MQAAAFGKVDCLEILVQAGADLEAKNNVRVEFDGHVYSVGIEGGRGRGNGVQGWGKGREGGVRVGWVGWRGVVKFIQILSLSNLSLQFISNK